MKKFRFCAVFLLAVFIAFPNASLSNAAQETRKVTDMGGTEVLLPKDVKTVINLWHANNQVVLLLGGADKLIGTTSIIKNLPWYAKVYPRIKDVKAYAISSGSGNFNTEEVLKANADVVITSSPQDAETLRNAGITTALVTFRDFEGLKKTVRVTARVLGGNAEKRAEQFIRYFDGNLKRIQKRLGDLKESDRPKVYQIRSKNPLETDGKISICTEWIEAAGGVNAIAHLTDKNMGSVTMEELLKVDPDYIIVATQGAGPVIDLIKNSSEWSTLKAVKNGRIYANPIGTFLWSRYSCEEALQVLWVAKLIHPDKFKDIDMNKEVRNFYRTFYNYDMTEEEARRMLAGLDPQ